MKNSFDFFDNIYCINLPCSVQRKKHINDEFNTIGISKKVQYISAMPPHKELKMSNLHRNPAGELGCSLSHLKAIVHAISINADNILIIEDDATFAKNTNQLLNNCITELPNDWGIFYLSARPREKPKKYSKHLVKTNKMVLTTAYAISKKHMLPYYDFFLDELGRDYPHAACDIILSTYAEKNNGYCAFPIICTQNNSPSLISSDNNKHIGGNITKHIAEGWMKFPPK